MAAPVATPPSNNQQGGGPNAGITFPEIEAQLKEAERLALGPKLDDVKFEGEDIPENMRGKTAREGLNYIKQLEDTLRSSEIARQQALATANLASQHSAPAPVAAPEIKEEPLVTSDEVAAAFQEDPVKGAKLMERMTNQQIERASTAFMQRVAPMLAGTSSVAEAEAKRRYPDEFDIYKTEIENLLKQVPDRSVMTTQQSWDDLIAFARGRDPMRLFAHQQKKEELKRQTEAQEGQRNNAGVSMSSSHRAAPPSGGPVMDALTKEVCGVLGISEADYSTWSKVS